MPHARSQTRAARSTEISETLEDYLKIILDLAARHDSVRVSDIARAKAVSMPTVVIALHRLAAKGLVRYEARGPARLTAAGTTRARQLAGRHAFLERFLREILGVPGEMAADDACGMEHHLAPETLERLVAFVECLESRPQAAHACRSAGTDRARPRAGARKAKGMKHAGA